MKCPKCSKEIADNSQFCEFCGEKIQENTLPNERKSKKWLLWVVLVLVACGIATFIILYARGSSESTIDYVDLGLPSGTLWKSKMEPELYSWWEAKREFGEKLPKGVQMDELLTYCTQKEVVENNIRALKLTGPNGNHIVVFPMGYEAQSYINKNGTRIRQKGETWGISHCGFFLTSSEVGANVGGMEIDDKNGLVAKYSTIEACNYKCSVLLVKKK